MKTRNFLFTLLLLFASAAAQAQSTSNEYPYSISAQLTFASGTLTGAQIAQFYRVDLTLNGNLVAQPAPPSTAPGVPPPPSSISVDLVGKGSTTVVVGGVTYTYAQAIAIMQAVLAQERASQIAAYNAANSSAPAFTP